MNRAIGWILAAALVAAGWHLYGWQGLLVAGTVTVFWLLLQFNRAVRVMKNAGHAPIGRVPSAVMLNAKLRPGMTMLDLLHLTRSLGEPLPAPPDTWRWTDPGASSVTATFTPGGKLLAWQLGRPETPAGDEVSGEPPPSP